MPIAIQCQTCGSSFDVIPARKDSAKYCSKACQGKSKQIENAGENSPRWVGGEREKQCQGCGVIFAKPRRKPMSSFLAQKFCTKSCADEHGFRHEGEAHPSYKPDSRRKSRRGKHGSWARKVIERDGGACQMCGVMGVELHAHHMKSFAEYPELRWELDNGITLCFRCHWDVHTASNENGVNSGNIRPGNAEDNPEPSHDRKVVEGVTTRGRAFRRVNGECAHCGTFQSRRLSDVKPSGLMFCSKSHAVKYRWASRST